MKIVSSTGEETLKVNVSTVQKIPVFSMALPGSSQDVGKTHEDEYFLITVQTFDVASPVGLIIFI